MTFTKVVHLGNEFQYPFSCDPMESLLMRELSLSYLKDLGVASGGFISNAKSYCSDIGKIFVKHKEDHEVCI